MNVALEGAGFQSRDHAPSRRSLLRGVLVAAPVLALGAAAIALPETLLTDPLPGLLAEWREARDRWRVAIDAEGEDTPETEALWDERKRLDTLIMGTVATTPEGLRAQFEYMAEETMEDGTFCAMSKHLAAPFIDVFRAGLGRI